MGHVARLIEAAGIPTVIIAVQAFAPRLVPLTVPRLLLTPFLMGRPLGAPHDTERHLAVLQTALDLFDTAVAPGTLHYFPHPYRLAPTT